MNRRAYEDPSIGIALAMGAILAGKSTKRRTIHRTPAQVAASEKRAEIELWNEQVEMRKTAKRAHKNQQSEDK